MYPVLRKRKAEKKRLPYVQPFLPRQYRPLRNIRFRSHGAGLAVVRRQTKPENSRNRPHRGKDHHIHPRRITISRKAAHPAGATGKMCCCFIIINVSLLPQARLRKALCASEPARRRPLRLRREFQPQLRRGVLPLRRRRTARLPGSPVHCAPRS